MPFKTLYTCDGLMILANTTYMLQFIFFLWYAIKFRSLLTLESIEKDTIPYYQAMLGSFSLSMAILCEVLGVSLYFGAMFMNYNDYGVGGFTCGLLDTGNPGRNWYYVTGTILAILSLFFYVVFERARRILRQKAGLDENITFVDSFFDGNETVLQTLVDKGVDAMGFTGKATKKVINKIVPGRGNTT